MTPFLRTMNLVFIIHYNFNLWYKDCNNQPKEPLQTTTYIQIRKMGSLPQKDGTTTEISCEASWLLRTPVFDNSLASDEEIRTLFTWRTSRSSSLRIGMQSWYSGCQDDYPSLMAWDNDLQIQEAKYWFILLKENIKESHAVYLYCFTC